MIVMIKRYAWLRWGGFLVPWYNKNQLLQILAIVKLNLCGHILLDVCRLRYNTDLTERVQYILAEKQLKL